MIDAYTIGITLALEDGVSEGILAIRRDLAALDVAVAGSAARLLELRDLARSLAVPSPADRPIARPAAARPAMLRVQPTLAPTISAEPQTTQSKDEAPRDRRPAATIVRQSMPEPTDRPTTATAPDGGDKQPTSPIAPAAPGKVAPAPAASPAARQPIPPTPQPIAQPAVPPAVTAHVVGSRAPDPLAVGKPISPPTAMPSPTAMPLLYRAAAVSERVAAPALQRPAATIDLTPPAVSFVPPATPSPVADRKPSVPLSRFEPFGLHAKTPQDATSIPAPAAPLSSYPDSEPLIGSQREPTAPVLQAEKPRFTVADRQPDAKRPADNLPSADAPQENRPVYAEIHLDGAALGRWITRHLERQIARPQAGATGFDPRMTPSWPGAPIGN
jgi:hypothetical protein